MEPGRIIFLHGASSSGKSTLARALQARLPLAFWHISIDHLRDSGVLPLARFRSGEFGWHAARQPVFDGFHAALAAYAAAGNNLILEHILDTPGWLEALLEHLAPFDVFFAAVHCPLAELNQREAQRGDRPAGSAARDFAAIHQGLAYDFELDGRLAAAGNAAALIAAWQHRRRPLAFDRMRQARG